MNVKHAKRPVILTVRQLANYNARAKDFILTAIQRERHYSHVPVPCWRAAFALVNVAPEVWLLLAVQQQWSCKTRDKVPRLPAPL